MSTNPRPCGAWAFAMRLWGGVEPILIAPTSWTEPLESLCPNCARFSTTGTVEEYHQLDQAPQPPPRALISSTDAVILLVERSSAILSAVNAALCAERIALDLSTRRMTASVLLIKALGGGWGAWSS